MKQTVSKEIEEIKTDTYDKVNAELNFTIEGRRNVPNLENIGKAADAACWLFQTLIEASYIKDKELHKAEVVAAREIVKQQYLNKPTTPTPTNNPAPTPTP